MNRTADETPVACPLCGDERPKSACPLCKGLGVVDSATRAKWQSMARSKLTSGSIGLAGVAAAALERLQERSEPGLRKLTAEGQALLDEIAAWGEDGATGPEKRAMFDRVGEWQRRALSALADLAKRSGGAC